MLLNNKFDSNKGVTPNINIYESKVYTAKIVSGRFLDESNSLIAERKLLPLTQDSVYKTQFFNEELSNAIEPLTPETKIEYFDENEKRIDPLLLSASLIKERSSIVCDFEPEVTPKYVSVVIYKSLNQNDLLTKDGSVLMNAEYSPKFDTSLVTKKWVEKQISDFSTTLVRSDVPRIEADIHNGIFYGDNLEYPFVFYKDKVGFLEKRIKVTVDNIIIPAAYKKESTYISFVINEYPTDKFLWTDIVSDKTLLWKETSSENIYGEIEVDPFYFKKSFSYENLAHILTKYKKHDQDIYTLKFRISCGIESFDTTSCVIGLDEYIKVPLETEISLKFNQSKIESWKTKKVSGINYFPNDINIKYNLPLEISISNNFLCNFRTASNVKLSLIDGEQSILSEKELTLDTHFPLQGDLHFYTDIDFDCRARFVRVSTYNAINEELFYKDFELGVDVDDSDESLRVTTPSGEIKFPTKDYGGDWTKKEELEEWDMKLRNKIYSSEDKNSAVCFRINPQKECYSHLDFDIDYDGEMYIKSSGNTGWLSCEKKADLFKIPVNDGDPCRLEEHFVSFGRVVYNTPVFIRIIKASKVEFKGATLV